MGVPAPPGGRELETRGSPCPVLSSRAPVILQEKQTRLAEAPRLQLSSGFTWDVGLDSLTPALPPHGESSDSEEDEKPEQATVLYCLPGFCPFGRAAWRSVLAWVSLPAVWARLRLEGVFMELVDCPVGPQLPLQTSPRSEEQIAHLLFCLA